MTTRDEEEEEEDKEEEEVMEGKEGTKYERHASEV